MLRLLNAFHPLAHYRHQPGDPLLRVRMDITNRCNLLCRMCPHRLNLNRPTHDMPPELVQKIVDQIFPYTRTAILGCHGEPFMSQHMDEVLDILGKGPCRQIGIVTNATLLSEKVIQRLLDTPNLDSLAISVDGGTKETYERIRVNASWDRLVHNIEMVARMKRERAVSRPSLHMNMVLMRSTAPELPALVELAARVGVTQIAAIRLLELSPELRDEAIRDWDKVIPILIHARRMAHEHRINLLLPLNDERLSIEETTETEAGCNTAEVGRFSPYCEAPWNAVQIIPNGRVHPCGYYQKPLGDLHHQDFADIWNSKPYLELRRSLARCKLHAKCRECNPHGYDNIERKKQINR